MVKRLIYITQSGIGEPIIFVEVAATIPLLIDFRAFVVITCLLICTLLAGRSYSICSTTKLWNRTKRQLFFSPLVFSFLTFSNTST
ncbi:hypothetical protein F5Y09DRAFT_326359, partial [Xylaria sp. FL1042]